MKKIRKQHTGHTLGLALSGGGTRGFAHIGVFKAFAERGITFDCVAGTSAGSIMGAMYCAKIPPDKIVEKAKQLTKRDILNRRLIVGSSSQNIAHAARRLLGDVTFEELLIPFAAVAVDIVTGEEVVLDSGDLASAVAASSAVPALFTPMHLGGRVLVDGGLLNNMPADVCRSMGADIVVSVDLNHNRGKGTTSRRIKNVLIATWNITTKSTMYKGELNSDVIITPELSRYKKTSLENIDAMVEEGYRAANEKMDEIIELINTKF